MKCPIAGDHPFKRVSIGSSSWQLVHMFACFYIWRGKDMVIAEIMYCLNEIFSALLIDRLVNGLMELFGAVEDS